MQQKSFLLLHLGCRKDIHIYMTVQFTLLQLLIENSYTPDIQRYKCLVVVFFKHATRFRPGWGRKGGGTESVPLTLNIMKKKLSGNNLVWQLQVVVSGAWCCHGSGILNGILKCEMVVFLLMKVSLNVVILTDVCLLRNIVLFLRTFQQFLLVFWRSGKKIEIQDVGYEMTADLTSWRNCNVIWRHQATWRTPKDRFSDILYTL